MEFNFKVKNDNDEIIIYPEGELDIYVVSDFKKEILEIYNKEKKDIVIDGENLEYIDSTGLGSLVYILKELEKNNNKIIIKNIKKNIKKLFQITKLDELFIIRGEE